LPKMEFAFIYVYDNIRNYRKAKPYVKVGRGTTDLNGEESI
jgi:hypothetical protein